MKQVYSSKTAIGLLVFGLIILVGAVIFSAICMISSVRANEINMVGLFSVSILIFSLVTIWCFFALNREGCKVIYDCDKKVIYREGFFLGYKYQLKEEDIKEVIVVCVPKDDTYYILVDARNTKYTGGSGKSFIRLKETKENNEFIKQFWKKPCKEYREYADYVKLITNKRT